MNRLTIILYIIATICFTNTFAASTVKPIPNPHMSSNNGQCLCTAQALQAKNTIVSPTQLQPDTFLSMEKVKIDESRLETYFEVLDPPEIPRNPSNINVSKTVLKFSFIGFVLSLFFVFSTDAYRRNRKEFIAYLK